MRGSLLQQAGQLVSSACESHLRGALPSCLVALLQGSATYAPEKDALVWKIKNFPGGREFLLRCKFGLPSVAAEEETQGRLPPIKVKFEVSPAGHPRCAWHATAGGREQPARILLCAMFDSAVSARLTDEQHARVLRPTLRAPAWHGLLPGRSPTTASAASRSATLRSSSAAATRHCPGGFRVSRCWLSCFAQACPACLHAARGPAAIA